ncbi:hypothetical protein ACLOJK_011828 [Asimina triloba]
MSLVFGSNLLLCLCAAAVLVLVSGEEQQRLSAKDCENLGFTGLALCSDCNTFAEYVKDEGRFLAFSAGLPILDFPLLQPSSFDEISLKGAVALEMDMEVVWIGFVISRYSRYLRHLIEITSDLTPSETVAYSGAILEVCMRKLVFYPEVVAFIEEEKDQFPSLKVQYVYASPPRLALLDADGHLMETIRIDNWKREHIRQFLREKVKPGESSS